ncbi:MAG: anti-sigma factor [Candidatus Rokubacteria bacterium]|nr:anti-sigma factor [Candidatus Rokubacteria bacterium]
MTKSGALWRLAWAGTLAAAAFVVGYLGWTINGLERELKQQAGEAASLRTQIARQQEVLAILRAPETQVVALGGLQPSPAARGRIWWHREAGGFFVASGLPPAPAGKTYQLWVITAGTPVGAGVIDVDPAGTGTLRVSPHPRIEKVDLFAVTLEPTGGLAKPSGAMYLAGRAL